MSDLTGDEPISINPIDNLNWEDAANLQILPEQADFLTANVFSIAESKFYEELKPHAIYAGDTLVGFTMFGRDSDDRQYWVYRFMIDRRYQRKGYGRRAMLALIDMIRALPDATEINIGYDLGNTAAAELYKSVGFVEGDIAPWGERTAKLRLDVSAEDSVAPGEH